MLSPHPADQLLRELIRVRRPATPAEVGQILDRLATAPFDPLPRSVPMKERGKSHQGITLGGQAPSLEYHLVKRVVIEQQWVDGTTASGFVADLRRAVRDTDARLAVFERRGGSLAATVTPTSRVVTKVRQGSAALPNLLVVYSADRGIILTGYQFSTLSSTAIPSEALWLK